MSVTFKVVLLLVINSKCARCLPVFSVYINIPMQQSSHPPLLHGLYILWQFIYNSPRVLSMYLPWFLAHLWQREQVFIIAQKSQPMQIVKLWHTSCHSWQIPTENWQYPPLLQLLPLHPKAAPVPAAHSAFRSICRPITCLSPPCRLCTCACHLK